MIKRRSEFPLLLIMALLLQTLPLPTWCSGIAPDWLLAAVLLRALVSPTHCSLLSTWLLGLLADELMGSFLGVHAALYTLVVYLVLKLHRQIRAFPLHQLSLLNSFLLLWVSYVVLLLRPAAMTTGGILDATLSAILTTMVVSVMLAFAEHHRSARRLDT